MLSIKAIKSAGVTSTYFAKDDYYTKDWAEAQKESLWYGAGAERLGLTGPVSQEAFQALLEGKLADGTALGRRGENGERRHQPGWDLTFSAPKSVSILYEVGGDERLLKAHERAVSQALDRIEANAAKTRVTVNGERHLEGTANLVIARFNHDTSRELDPQLHTHGVVMNLTQRGDGHWRSLDSRGLYRMKMLGGAIYRAELARGLRELGYALERTHQDGRFEATAVPHCVMKAFSKRREAIEAALEKSILPDAKAAEQVTLNTRPYKRERERDILRGIWREAAREMGFEAQRVVGEHRRARGERRAGGPEVRPVPAKDRPPTEGRGLSDAGVRDEPMVGETPREAVRFAAAKLGERESVFTEDNVVLEALNHAMGEVRLEEVQSAIREAAEDKVLVSAWLDEQPAWSTPHALYLECSNIALMREGQGAVKPLYGRSQIQHVLDQRGLTEGQRAAAVMATTSSDRVVGIQGYAGTGKTYLLKTVRELAAQRGVELRGFAPSAAAANLLQQEVGIESTTLARALVDRKNALARNDKKALKAAGHDQQLWVVDESSMVSSRDLYELLKSAERTGARVLLVGDVKQLGAVEAGKPFAQLQRGGMAVTVMQDILRQTNEQALAAVKDSIAGKARAALNRIKDTVQEIQDKEKRLQAIARHYLSLSPADRDQTLVLSPANEDRVALNRLIREGLRQAGVLGGEKGETIVYVNQGLTRVEKARASSYKKDDVVCFQRAYRTLGIEKGEYARVVGLEQHAGVVRLQTLEGRAIEWQPDKVAGAARRSGVEVFKAEPRDLRAGDRVRWTRNDKDRALRNAEQARVVEFKGQRVSFELSNGSRLTVDISRPENRHWEHAYTSTVYSAQGQTARTVLVNGEDGYPLKAGQNAVLAAVF